MSERASEIPHEPKPGPVPLGVPILRQAAVADYPCYSARLINPFLQLLLQFSDRPEFAQLKALELDERVPIAAAHELLDAVVRATGDPLLGLKAGRLMSPGDTGALHYAMSTSERLADAFAVAARYGVLINDALDLRVEIEGKHAHWRLDSRVVIPPASEDFMLAGTYTSYVRTLLGTAEELECWLTHSAPQDTREYDKTFAPARLRFAAPYTAFVFDAARLELRLPNADPKLHSLVRRHADLLLAELPKTQSFTEKVRTLLVKELANAQPSASRIAQQLRMSPRTLGRRLEDEGTTFRSLLDDLRRGLALRYLGSQHLALAEVAFLLGFSEVAAFHRAFKRWTGQTPLEYRRAQRAGNVSATK